MQSWAPRPSPLAWCKADTNPTLSRMHAPRGSTCDWYLRQPRRRRKRLFRMQSRGRSKRLRASKAPTASRVIVPPIERDPSSPLLAALIKTVEQTTGAPAQVSYFTGYTDTAVIAGTCSNHNCMSYGPGSLALAHKPNEWVSRDDIQRVEAVLTDLLLSQSGLA